MSDTVEGEMIGADAVNTKGLHNVFWKTRDGKLICIKDMTDSHIRNCAMFLTEFGYIHCVAEPKRRLIWLRVLNMEWQMRMAVRAAGIKKFKFNPDENKFLIND